MVSKVQQHQRYYNIDGNKKQTQNPFKRSTTNKENAPHMCSCVCLRAMERERERLYFVTGGVQKYLPAEIHIRLFRFGWSSLRFE